MDANKRVVLAFVERLLLNEQGQDVDRWSREQVEDIASALERLDQPGAAGVLRRRSQRPPGNSLTEMLDWLRSRGWMVGVHNDYRTANGVMTFWLFTHSSGRYIKGEAPDDLLAVSLVMDQVKTIRTDQ